MNNFGKGFIDAFSSNMQQDKPAPVTTPQLPQRTGVNKKKASNLQQNLINVISQTKVMPQEGA